MKALWIVDASYLIKGAPDKFDYLKLRNFLESINGEKITEAYYLNSTQNPPTDQQDSFHTWLKTAPPKGPQMRVKLYKLKDLHLECNSCHQLVDKQVQKGVDVGIVTLAIKLATQNQYDRLLLSAGDGDFEDAIDYIKTELHKELWLTGYTNSLSADLQSYAQRVIWLDESEAWDKIKK
jgi:nijmegen breakage syndrome protein 1